MTYKWITAKEGVRYREHPTRKHGVGFDRYYTVRYYDADNNRIEEALGWASKEGWTVKKAAEELAKLKANKTTGTGPQSLRDSREQARQRKKEQVEQKKQEDIRSLSFSDIFASYLVHSQAKKKNPRSWKREEQLARLYLFPMIGKLPLNKIGRVPHLQKIQSDMTKGGSSPRTIRYVLHVVRIVFNFAGDEGLYSGDNPAREKKKASVSSNAAGIEYPQQDNKKDRYLSREEADLLLAELAKRSTEVHNMAFLSLYTGMRFGEVANLKWGDVDLFQGIIMLRNTKNGKDRPAYMNPDIRKMLAGRKKLAGIGSGDDEKLVFPARGTDNKPHYMISSVYYKVVKEFFNNGVADKKQWVNFHTLRHTFASWLVEQGTDIYLVKDLLGHSDLKITERYAHIGENQLRQAVLKLQNS